MKKKHCAVAADIRPGGASAGLVAESRTTASSIPRSQPKAYCPNVSSAMTKAPNADARPIFRFGPLADSSWKNHSARPESTKHNAVLNFIVAKPGRTLFRMGQLKTHPINAAPATVITKMLTMAVSRS